MGAAWLPMAASCPRPDPQQRRYQQRWQRNLSQRYGPLSLRPRAPRPRQPRGPRERHRRGHHTENSGAATVAASARGTARGGARVSRGDQPLQLQLDTVLAQQQRVPSPPAPASGCRPGRPRRPRRPWQPPLRRVGRGRRGDAARATPQVVPRPRAEEPAAVPAATRPVHADVHADVHIVTVTASVHGHVDRPPATGPVALVPPRGVLRLVLHPPRGREGPPEGRPAG